MKRSRAKRYGVGKDSRGQWATAKGAVSHRLRVLEQNASLLISHDISTQDRVRVLEKVIEGLLEAKKWQSRKDPGA